MIYEEILLYHHPDFKKDYLSKMSKGESITQHILKNDNSKVVSLIYFDKFFLEKFLISIKNENSLTNQMITRNTHQMTTFNNFNMN